MSEFCRWQETFEAIADKCWTRIAANNGFFDEEYMKKCIFDAIMEGGSTVYDDIEEQLGSDAMIASEYE